MTAWARTVLPNISEPLLREMGRPYLVPDSDKKQHQRAIAVARRLLNEVEAGRNFLKQSGIVVGAEPRGEVESSATGQLWHFLRESWVATQRLEYAVKFAGSLDPSGREWPRGLQALVVEMASPTREEIQRRSSTFSLGRLETMEQLEAAAIIAGFFTRSLAKTVLKGESDVEGATVNTGRKRLRLEIWRALGARRQPKRTIQ